MKDRLVLDCVQILRLLLEGETNVNSIIKKTSLYKNRVFEAIRELEKGQLIEEIPSKSHEQKKIKRLLPMGIQLAELRKYTEQFNMSCRLMKAIKENFENGEIPDNILKARLLNKKWTPEEISRYYDWDLRCKGFGMESGYNFIVALCARYVSLLFEMGYKEISRLILSKIFTEAVNQRGSAEYSSEQPKVLGDREFEVTLLTFNKELDAKALLQLERPVINYIDEYSSDKEAPKYLNNGFVEKEAKEVINSISYVIDPPSKRNSPGAYFYLKPELEFNGW